MKIRLKSPKLIGYLKIVLNVNLNIKNRKNKEWHLLGYRKDEKEIRKWIWMKSSFFNDEYFFQHLKPIFKIN